MSIKQAVDKTVADFIDLGKQECGIKIKKETLNFARKPLEDFLECVNTFKIREFYKNSDSDSLTYSNVWSRGQKEFFITLQFTGARCRIGFYKQKKGETSLINMLQQKIITDSDITFFEVSLTKAESK
ncbi:MAG: hypothetical protein L3I99_06110 [Sulfurimonas sp.]|nr:hypothetical protein [Sulfurimonas sp.]